MTRATHDTIYVVTFAAYCGLTSTLGEFESVAEARACVRQSNFRARRRGCPVVRLGRRSWEHQEPEDCLLVPDFCGVLVVTKRRL